MRASLRAVAALLFGSGFSALVYQTAWQRSFRLTFGSSTGASAAVLAVFLGGLGVGGVLLGRRIERSRRPLEVYGNLELVIALLAGVSPFLGQGVHWLYLTLGGGAALGTLGATVVRLLCAAVVIGPAAVLMGGTLPAAARAVVTDEDANRSRLALLYALNTTGAVFGAVVGPLFLFGLLGTRLTLWAAVCLNLIVAVVARALARDLEPIADAPPAKLEANADEIAVAEPGEQVSASVVYLVAAAVGFVFLAMELVWYRMLAPILGGSSVTFGLILATALAGIGFGGYWHSRRASHKTASLPLLATTLALEALVVMVPFAWGDDLALVVAHLRTMANLGYGHLVIGWLVITFVVVFPASIVSGYQFPLLFALLGRGRTGVAEHVGITYGWNTVGTILGSLVGGFLMFPLLGAVSAWRVLAWVLVLLSLACAYVAWHSARSFGRLVAPLVASALALVLSASAGPGHVWRHTPIGAGRVELAKKSPNDVLAWRARTERSIFWEEDGLESTVALDGSNGWSFVVNGKSDGSVIADRGTQAFSGLLPALLHGHAKQAFVVGLGTGMTAGLLGKVPGIEKVTVAELEPSIVEVARRSSLVNGDVLNNPRVQLAFGDGREILLTSQQDFDLIISEPSNPYRIGIASLFTQEFYQAVESRLRDKGYFVQWIQGYEIDASALSIAIHTMRTVFPYVSIWGPEGSDLLLVATREPQVVDAARIRGMIEHPAYEEWLRRVWQAEGVEAVLAHHLVPPQLTDALAEQLPEPVNTDDLNYLEFAFARRVGDHHYQALADLHEAIEGKDQRPVVRGDVDWARVADLRHGVGWDGYRGPAPSQKHRAVVAGCSGDISKAARLWPKDAPPADLVETWVWAEIVASLGGDEVHPLAQSFAAQGFVAESLALEARHAEVRGNFGEATRLLGETFEAMRHKAYPLCDLASSALAQAERLAERDARFAESLLRSLAKGPFAVNEREELRQTTQAVVGARTGDAEKCVAGLGSMRETPVWEALPLSLRASCLREAGTPDAARAFDDLVSYVNQEAAAFVPRASLLPPLRAWVAQSLPRDPSHPKLQGAQPEGTHADGGAAAPVNEAPNSPSVAAAPSGAPLAAPSLPAPSVSTPPNAITPAPQPADTQPKK